MEADVLVIGPQARTRKAATEDMLARLIKATPDVRTEISILNALSQGAEDETLRVVLLYVDMGNIEEVSQGMVSRLKERYPTTPILVVVPDDALEYQLLQACGGGCIQQVLRNGFDPKALLPYFTVPKHQLAAS